MVRRSSLETKTAAMRMLERGYHVHVVADALGVARRTVYSWRRNYKHNGHFSRQRHPRLLGRPRRLSAADVQYIVDTVHTYPDIYLDELCVKLLADRNVCSSITMIHNALARCNMTHKLLRKLAIERDEQRRADWWTRVAEHELHAEQFVFVDESAKDERTSFRKYGRGLKGRRISKFAPFVRGVRYSILPAMSMEGYLACKIVEGSFVKDSFNDFILDEVV